MFFFLLCLKNTDFGAVSKPLYNCMPSLSVRLAPLAPPDPGGGPWIFLQGLGTAFLEVLASKLTAAGVSVLRVNFCGGDPLFGGPEDQINFTGHQRDLPAFYAKLIKDHRAQGFLLFGDERPIHRPAIVAAREADIPILVYEEGYLRPNWITVENGGANANSLFPTNAETLRELAGPLNDPGRGPSLPPAMPPRVKNDIKHKAGNIFLGYRFPHYQTHRPDPMWKEAKSWVARFLTRHKRASIARALEARYRTETPPYFLIPLQLSSDTQIRVHSAFKGMPHFIETVCQSFAAHAPAECRLLIKNHPLDNGLLPYGRQIKELSRQLGIEDRVDFIEGGDLSRMIKHSRGVVTVNSTVGLTTLAALKPLCVLGKALYDIAGLTHGGSLDTFWRAPTEPAPDLVWSLLKLLKHGCMVEGDLFTETGIDLASNGVRDIVLGTRPRLIAVEPDEPAP